MQSSQRRLKHVLPGLAFLAVSIYAALLWKESAIRPMEILDAMAIYRLVSSETVAMPVMDAPMDAPMTTMFFPKLGVAGRVDTSTDDIQPEYAPSPIDILSTQHTTFITPIVTMDNPERHDVTTVTESFTKTLFLTETASLTETTSLTETITEMLETTQIVTRTVTTTVTDPARASDVSPKEAASFNWIYPASILAILGTGLFAYFVVDEALVTAMVATEERRKRSVLSNEAPKRATGGEEKPEHAEVGTAREESPTVVGEQVTSERSAEEPEEAEIPWGSGLETIDEEDDGIEEAFEEVGRVTNAGGMKAESREGGKQDMDEIF